MQSLDINQACNGHQSSLDSYESTPSKWVCSKRRANSRSARQPSTSHGRPSTSHVADLAPSQARTWRHATTLIGDVLDQLKAKHHPRSPTQKAAYHINPLAVSRPASGLDQIGRRSSRSAGNNLDVEIEPELDTRHNLSRQPGSSGWHERPVCANHRVTEVDAQSRSAERRSLSRSPVRQEYKATTAYQLIAPWYLQRRTWKVGRI